MDRNPLSRINVYDPVTEKVTYYGADKSGEKLNDNHFWAAFKTRR
jgi:hypothetical protein